jgi:NADP-dependent 3-hydroxy acid dehydrogenase YdfG
MNSPRHILITGASSGLGAALAIEYAAAGTRLSLHGRDGERLAQVAKEAQQRGADISTQIGDVCAAAAMANWITACNAAVPIDLVIANAGISAGTARGVESAAQARLIFDVNVGGMLNTVQPALPLMVQRQQGQIAIVSSLAGFRGFPGAPSYCASKAAARIYGEGLRGGVAPHNIAVNVICPGFVKTPMTDANRFPMPFLLAPEHAAHIIRRGLAANKGRIAFPWPMYVLTRMITALPQPLMDWIAARTPKK